MMSTPDAVAAFGELGIDEEMVRRAGVVSVALDIASKYMTFEFAATDIATIANYIITSKGLDFGDDDGPEEEVDEYTDPFEDLNAFITRLNSTREPVEFDDDEDEEDDEDE